MKKTLFSICALAAAMPLFAAHPNTERLTVDQLKTRMESMRTYDWGKSAGPLEAYIYATYLTGTSDKKNGAELEQKAVSELASGQGTLRYKLLLAETLEICGIQSTAMQLGDILVKESAKAENLSWIERSISALGRASDPKAKDALVKLLANKNEQISNAAITALGVRREGMQEISQIAAKAKSDKKIMACAVALGRIGAPALKVLDGLYGKAKSPYLKQIIADSIFAVKTPKADALAKFANKVIADQAAPEGAKLEAYATLVRAGNAPAPKDSAQTTIAIEVMKRNPKLAIPSYLELSKLDEAHQVLMVNTLAERGEGYDKIIALTPKTPQLAEAILIAASRMGSDKDYKKLVSFAPLFSDRQYREMSTYISAIKGEKKVLKLSELSKSASAQEQGLIAAALDNLDSSSSIDVLLKDVKSGDSTSKIAALKALNTSIAKLDQAFIAVCEMYPTFTDAQVLSTAQRLLVNISRLKCDDKMFAAAKAQYDASKDEKTKKFFVRFASAASTKPAAEFLASVYASGMKKEALAEYAKWTTDTAFASLQKIEKSDPAGAAEIRDIYIKLLRDTNSIKSDYLQYIVKTAKTERERNLINMLEMPNFAKAKSVKSKDGVTISATHGDDLRYICDGDISTRWSSGQSRQPGMGLLFELPKQETLKAVELELANSRGDRVLDPLVFVGDAPDNMKKAEFEHVKAEHSDIIKFKKPTSCKVVCIVNTRGQGGHWSAYEVKFDK